MHAREREAARIMRETDTEGKRMRSRMKTEREGTHNRLAAPVLMLRPAGPLADLAKAIVDRGAGSLPCVCTQYASAFLSLCLSACP